MDHGEDLPLPPPISSDVEPVQAISDKGDPSRSQPLKGHDQTSKPKMILATRPGSGKRGDPITLLCNHFDVKFSGNDESFYQYSVLLEYEDGSPVVGKGIGRKVVEKMKQTYGSLLGNKPLAYDGEKTLFSLGTLSMGTVPQKEFNFDIVLEDLSSGRTRRGSPGGNPAGDDSGGSDRKRLRKPYSTKTFKVVLKLITEIPISVIAQAMKRHESENTQEAFRVLDIILRQHSAAKGCLLVRQSFFHDNPDNFIVLGGGVMGCPGFHSSFCTTQSGVSLNIDVSTTTIIKPGPVIDFLMVNQNINNPNQIEWQKARRVLKNLRIRYTLTNQEYKIVGLSEFPSRKQTFMLKQRNGGGEREVTVSKYYMEKKIDLRFDNFPCINVGKPRRPTFFPPELCHLVSLQRYTKALNSLQRASLVEKSRQRPLERMHILKDARSNYDSEPILRASGVAISPSFTEVDGRVLPAPKLLTGNGDFVPRDGRWNFNNKTLYRPCFVHRWAVVNFSVQCNVRNLVQSLIRCGQMKGVKIDQPFDHVFEEERNMQGASPNERVDKMFEQLQSGQRKLPKAPLFLLCLLPKKKNSDIYGPWKRKCLADSGIVTQCLAPTKVNDQYLTNLLLKINAKLGGMNSLLQIEGCSPSISLISSIPTIILGMDVSHGSPGQSDRPSIAAVVSSRQWPSISNYRASVHAQSAKVEMIDSLFKPKGTNDEGIIRELLKDFYASSKNIKPEHVIIFRDGVSESQFNQVLNIELDQIMAACKFLDENWNPKFTVIVAQKNHHTRFFIPNNPNNVPPGTVIDKKVCHPRNYDFYLCSHKGAIGTSRPIHYHVLLDQIGFKPDDLQDLVHSLSYIYQRSTTAISVVAPIYYAHLAAAQVGQFMKFDDSDTSSCQGGQSSEGSAPVPELPRLHKDVRSSMFFC